MGSAEPTKNWYSQDLEQRKHWYRAVADAYNRARPRYPQKLIGRTVELAQLPSEAIVLEVGCGPGTATTDFAQLGFSMVCLEPSPDACQLARQNCQQYPDVEILNTTFEEWAIETEKFNAVLAATSFHWVSSEIGYPKAAEALKDNGSLILLWNTPPQPNNEVFQVLNEVYQTHAPSLTPYEDRTTHEENLSKFGQAVIDSGLFKNLRSEQLVCEVTYRIDDYLALLSTLSPYIALDPPRRNALFEALRDTLERHYGSGLQTSSLSMLQIAQKV